VKIEKLVIRDKYEPEKYEAFVGLKYGYLRDITDKINEIIDHLNGDVPLPDKEVSDV
jgi:hypothetical protein